MPRPPAATGGAAPSTARHEDHDPRPSGHVDGFGDEAGLPHARLSGHDDDPAATADEVADRRIEPSQLR